MPSELAAAYAVAVLALLVFPILLARGVAAHTGVPGREAVRGALGFVVAQLFLGVVGISLQPALAAIGGLWARAALLGGASAAVEEGGRIWALLRAGRAGPAAPAGHIGSRGLLFAIGWAGCEAALAGAFLLTTLAQLLYGDPDRALGEMLSGPELEQALHVLDTQRAAMLSAPAWSPLATLAERAGIAAVQIFLTALVLRGLRERRFRLILGAVGVNAALVAALTVLGSGAALATLESALVALVVGLVALPAGLALFRGTPPEPGAA